MRNSNKDYFITLNAKTSTVTASSNLSFYITDKNTSNIFCQLIFNESNNQLINSYAPNENAEDYDITLRIVKPNNEPKEIKFQILNAPTFVYYVDLTDDYKDIIGTYECECFIDSMINGRLERSTTNSFTYTVTKSIMSELDGLLEDLPGYPLIDTLATKEYVDAAVAAGVGGGSSYDDSELRTLISGKANTNHTHTELHTHSNKEVLDGITADKIAAWDSGTESGSGSSIDLSNYAPIESPVFTGSISLGRTGKVGNYSFAVGNNVEASGDYSHAEGNNTIASGLYSHAEGNGTLARGFSAHAEGNGCKVGSSSILGAEYAHAEGEYTLSSSKSQHVQGKFNIEDTKNKYAHIVGNGTNVNNRSNAHTLDWSGNGWYAGELYVGGTSQTDSNKVLSTADISFTADGDLSITIDGVTKLFTPKA